MTWGSWIYLHSLDDSQPFTDVVTSSTEGWSQLPLLVSFSRFHVIFWRFISLIPLWDKCHKAEFTHLSYCCSASVVSRAKDSRHNSGLSGFWAELSHKTKGKIYNFINNFQEICPQPQVHLIVLDSPASAGPASSVWGAPWGTTKRQQCMKHYWHSGSHIVYWQNCLVTTQHTFHTAVCCVSQQQHLRVSR